MTIRSELDEALQDAPYLQRDLAMVALARQYADLIDDCADRLDQADEDDEPANFNRMVAAIARIGPRLENVLDKMGMAPGARPMVPERAPGGPDPRTAGLDALRGDAAAGIDYAAAVDPAVTGSDPGD